MLLTRWADRDNFREVEKEWQYEFVFYVLSSAGIPEEILSECLPETGFGDFSVKHHKRLRKHCGDFNITIVDDRDGGLKIYVEISYDDKVEQVLIAEWKKCRFNYREDPNEVDPAKKMYVEIVADPWFVNEGQDE